MLRNGIMDYVRKVDSGGWCACVRVGDETKRECMFCLVLQRLDLGGGGKGSVGVGCR
jgi:hypothetical protein